MDAEESGLGSPQFGRRMWGLRELCQKFIAERTVAMPALRWERRKLVSTHNCRLKFWFLARKTDGLCEKQSLRDDSRLYSHTLARLSDYNTAHGYSPPRGCLLSMLLRAYKSSSALLLLYRPRVSSAGKLFPPYMQVFFLIFLFFRSMARELFFLPHKLSLFSRSL